MNKLKTTLSITVSEILTSRLMSTRKSIIENTLKMGSLKIWDFMYPKHDLQLSQINHFFLWPGATHIKNSIRDAGTPRSGEIVFNTMRYRSSETVHRLRYFQSSVSVQIKFK